MAAGRHGKIGCDAQGCDTISPWAFLSSRFSGGDFARKLSEKLTRFPLLAGLSDPALRQLVAQACWFGLPGGTVLKRDSENETALFLVITGTLGVVLEDGAGVRRLIAQVPPGETVGEVSLLTEEHSAELVALRDTELLRIGPQAFEALIARQPRVMIDMMAVMARRLMQTNRAPREAVRPKTFAIVPLQDGLLADPLAHRVAGALVAMGAKTAVLDAGRCRNRCATSKNGYAGGPSCCCCMMAAAVICRSRWHAKAIGSRPFITFIPRAAMTLRVWRAVSPAAPWAWCWAVVARAVSPISAWCGRSPKRAFRSIISAGFRWGPSLLRAWRQAGATKNYPSECAPYSSLPSRYRTTPCR